MTLPVLVADISNNLLIETAKTGRVLFFNRKAACIFSGLRRQRKLAEIIPADSFVVLQQNIDAAFYQQYPHHFYWMFQNRFYLIYIYPLNESVWLSLEDITEKRQQAHLLYLNAQRTLFAERIAQLGYWELDITHKRFYWSEEMYKIFGVKTGEAAYHYNLVRKGIHPEDLPVYRQKLRELIAEHKEIEGRVRIIASDGRLKYCRFMAGILFESGEAKAAGVFQDISELIEAQHDLDKAKKAAEEASLAKSYFLAQASHDIRQPLQAMALFVEGLKTAPVEKHAEIIGKISKLSHSLTTMLNNVLDVSKLDSGGMSFEARNFNLAELLHGICEEYHDMATGRHIKLVCRLQNQVVNQDSFLIERMLRNLLSNALKYARSTIKVGNKGKRFWVADDGCGINKDKQKHIFNAFYQCNTLIDKKGCGAGLGLHIAGKIADVIGAKIKVRSKDGCYTVFEVCL